MSHPSNARRGILLLSLILSAPVGAESFTVQAQVQCPASLSMDASGNTVLDATFATPSIQWVPCAGVLVTAKDADTDWDDYCGSAFTDSAGRVNFAAQCSDDAVSGPPDVYLEISARSPLGFEVGTHDYGTWEIIGEVLATVATNGLYALGEALAAAGGELPPALMAFDTARWVSNQRDGNQGAVLNFGSLAMGDDFDHAGSPSASPTLDNEPPAWAARQFWATSYSVQTLRNNTTRLPMYFRYMVDNSFLGSPTTLWDTVIVDEDRFRNDATWMLAATPHEIGHVIHNTYHSGYQHWLFEDGLHYAKTHFGCGSDTLILAWYEGFANFIGDLVFHADPRGVQDTGLAVGDPATSTYVPFDPWANCASNANTAAGRFGFAVEGNVEDVLTTLYLGPRTGLFDLNHSPHDSEFVCPTGWERYQSNGQWECRRERRPVCSATLLVDAANFVDHCQVCIESWSDIQPLSTTACPEGQLCLAGSFVYDGDLGAFTPTVPEDEPPPTTSITVEVNEDGSVTVNEPPENDASGSSEPDALCFAQPTRCGQYDQDGNTQISLYRQFGEDRCFSSRQSTWDPPQNPAGPVPTPRADGTPSGIITATTAGPREWFAFPNLDDIIGWVVASGSGEHRLQEHWNATLRDFCRNRTDAFGRSYFCHPDHSAEFRQDVNALGTLQW